MAYIISFILIIFSGLFSGLNLGLLRLSKQELRRKARLGDIDAKKVYGVRKNGNLLLATLLIGNVAVNAALAIFLGSITSGLIAGFVSTALIVIFGEIVPQAVFSRFALPLGSRTAWLVWVFIVIFFPICWPIAWVLDKALGKELATVYSKQELKMIIEEHEDSGLSDIDEEEERIVKGALSFSDKKVSDIMTPRPVVKAFSTSQKVDDSFIDSVRHLGLSRYPVYEGNLDNVVGIFYMKDLLNKDNVGGAIGSIVEEKVNVVLESDTLDNIFSAFLDSRQHMFIVEDEFGSFAGVVTLEDVLEEIIKEEIVDEHDRHRDLREQARRLAQK